VQAVILAAGQGRRLADRRGRPKCLRRVGRVALVHHQLRALAAVGVDDVLMVVGFEQGQVRAAVGGAAHYVVNPRYSTTNSMYSFLLARPMVHDDVIVMNSDLFFHPALLSRLLQAGGDALLFDSASGDEEEHMKVCSAGGLLVEMSKGMRPERVAGENVGVLRLSATTAQHVFEAACTIAAGGDRRAWLASAINRVAVDTPIRCLDVAGWPWVEIDFQEDLARARGDVFPQVAAVLCANELTLAEATASLRSVS
jgi:choline kinase